MLDKYLTGTSKLDVVTPVIHLSSVILLESVIKPNTNLSNDGIGTKINKFLN